MRLPHVYQRSKPKANRNVQGAVDRAATAHTVAVQLGLIIDKVDQVGLSDWGICSRKLGSWLIEQQANDTARDRVARLALA